jgi:amidase
MWNRRQFLQHSAAGAATAWLAGCRVASGPAGTTVPGIPGANFPLAEATIAELQQAMQRGQRTARSITELYLARIHELDRQGPMLGAILELNPDALRIADELDAERKAKGARGPLHGIPVLLKDNIDTADRMTTTAGSLALEGSIAPRDSTVAQRLRAAGAILLGKANMSEWANFRSTHSVSGWSGRGGQCRNPYSLDRSPCGSSSGSGAAVAANLCAVAIGSETDGSIVCPSATNGIVGIKPTLGLVSRAGIIPIAASQDTAGPMCRTVTDAAILLGVIAGGASRDPRDPRDPATAAAADKVTDYTKALDPNGLRGARIGVARKFFGYQPDLDALAEAALAVMKQQGAEIIDPVELPSMAEIGDSELEVLLYEFKDGLNRYLADLGPNAPVKSLAEIIEFNRKHAAREMPLFAQELFEKAQAKGPLTDAAYRDALAKNLRVARAEGIEALMDQHKLDAFFAPTNSAAWVIDPISGDHVLGGSSTPAAVAGTPSITVPIGFLHGLPVGASLFGRAFSEATLIRLAYAYEQASKARRPPELPAKIVIG